MSSNNRSDLYFCIFLNIFTDFSNIIAKDLGCANRVTVIDSKREFADSCSNSGGIICVQFRANLPFTVGIPITSHHLWITVIPYV